MDRVSEEEEDHSDDRLSEDPQIPTGYDPENEDGSSEIVAGPGRLTQETRDEPVLSDRERDLPQTDKEDTIPQPIPFQMGVTPQEEPQIEDELADWYDTTPSGARGSTETGPAPKAKAVGRRERSPRNLRNRQVARSIMSRRYGTPLYWSR